MTNKYSETHYFLAAWSVFAGILVTIAIWSKYAGGAEASVAAQFTLLSSFAWVACTTWLAGIAATVAPRDRWWSQFVVVGACLLSSLGITHTIALCIGHATFEAITAQSDVVAIHAFAKLEQGLVASVFLTPIIALAVRAAVPRVAAWLCSAIGILYGCFFFALP